MIKFIKNLLNKNVVKIIPRKLTDNEKALLYRIDSNGIYSNYKDKEFYLLDGRFIKYLGAWSYPDVDMTKSGSVGKVLETGEIIDISYQYLFHNKPHTWVKLLSDSDIFNYSIDSEMGKDYLYSKYFKKLPIEVIREFKLKEILNEN
jgi:hypothetical protein